jgi:hypothetical protein
LGQVTTDALLLKLGAAPEPPKDLGTTWTLYLNYLSAFTSLVNGYHHIDGPTDLANYTRYHKKLDDIYLAHVDPST